MLVSGVADRALLAIDVDCEAGMLSAEPVGGVLGRRAAAIVADAVSTVVEAGEP